MIQSLDKALRILSLFTPQNPELSLMEISKLTDMQKSSVYKILQTFALNGYLKQDRASKKYRLGNKIAELSSTFFKMDNMSSFLHKKLKAMANLTGENLYYAVPYGLEILYIDAVSSLSSVIEPSVRGAVAPISCTALGKAIIAFSDGKLLDDVLDAGLIGATQHSILSNEEYIEEIRKTQARGYAIDNMEHVYGIVCVAVPICKNGKAVGAISISGPSLRFPEEKIDEYAKALTDIKTQAEIYV